MHRSRSSSLRDIFVKSIVKKTKKPEKKKATVQRLRGRYLFRATTWLVLEYMEWIKEAPALEETVSDDITKNVKIAQGKRVPERKKLTLKDRSVLLTDISGRSKETRAYLAALIRNLQPYKKYPESMWDQIAGVTGYRYFGPERVLVRQGQMPDMLYYIVKGEVNVAKIVEDNVTGPYSVLKETESKTIWKHSDLETCLAKLHYCILFPDPLRLLLKVYEQSSVDLFTITREDFNKVLRPWLTEQWEIFKDAMVNFNYFKGWNEETVRECCILSKIKDYQPDEVLLGDAKGMVNYVYFILDGKCRVIEHMIIHEEFVGNKVKYKLYNREEVESLDQSLSQVPRAKEKLQEKIKGVEQVEEAEGIERVSDSLSQQRAKLSIGKGVQSTASEIDYTQLMLSKRPMNVDMERTSIFTLTLQDVVNEWHEITDVAAMLMKEPSTISEQTYPKNVHTVFMQVCVFNRGACFGLGERMYNRRVVSISPTRCLLVPRYWLLEHNRANIWERVKLFMDSQYPTTRQLFKKFVRNRRWMKYKKELVHHIIENGRKTPNSTTIHDVPYSIRIAEEIDTIERN